MTVPEENRRKTDTTDDVLETREQRSAEQGRERGASGRTLREAMEEAEVRPEDYEEK
ncbi:MULTISPECIES: hypothetical protein [Streptomyces]|uniref:Uncharacterized protein n=1 Tax=Streptomyces griseosporeus TaxID=1910 RepID=A0ABV3KX21_STRGS|nr:MULTISPECIES: hypothetical protein [Streptomyces]MBM4823841.1 hypothetical protein [Streptomyces actuosus]GHF40003.1 hypothetical protein GCM10018783_05740 [Streptomyces griseosporeus]